VLRRASIAHRSCCFRFASSNALFTRKPAAAARMWRMSDCSTCSGGRPRSAAPPTASASAGSGSEAVDAIASICSAMCVRYCS
jgi:hypothetical protein